MNLQNRLIDAENLQLPKGREWKREKLGVLYYQICSTTYKTGEQQCPTVYSTGNYIQSQNK